jgi:ADP-dependent NAD(P)H-hydrate dehydratase
MTRLEDQTESPLPVLRPRNADSHKGNYGRALLIGGSRGMSGAISLAGMSTLRSGAGLVTLAVPRCVQDLVASFSACYMTHGLDDAAGQFAAGVIGEAATIAANATVLALGPGLGRSEVLNQVVARLYGAIQQPMVVDADALFALAEQYELLVAPGGPRVLTPHPGEFARLTGSLPDESQRISAAAELARRDTGGNTIVVLKGHETVVTDGQRYSLNRTGNPGMATGGSGDVLTGIITALLCQGLEPFDAARLGVHVHGLAGDLAAADLGQVSLIASDLIDYLPRAFQAVAKQSANDARIGFG